MSIGKDDISQVKRIFGYVVTEINSIVSQHTGVVIETRVSGEMKSSVFQQPANIIKDKAVFTRRHFYDSGIV
jgi:UDP-glucose 6-dehydrogenase